MTSDPEQRNLVVTRRYDIRVHYLTLMDDFLAKLDRAFDDLLSIPQSRGIYRTLPKLKRRAPRLTRSRTLSNSATNAAPALRDGRRRGRMSANSRRRVSAAQKARRAKQEAEGPAISGPDTTARKKK
jgi:hypothetical protein